MSTFAVTYTFVVEADDVEDAPSAVEEYIHSTRGSLDSPIEIELLDD